MQFQGRVPMTKGVNNMIIEDVVLSDPPGRTVLIFIRTLDSNLLDSKGRVWFVPPDPWDEDRAWKVINLEVDPKYRNQGIGTSLMKYLVENYGTRRMKLSVAEDNETARRIYKLVGFVETGNTQMTRELLSL